MILLASISNHVQVRSCVKSCGTLPQLEVTYAFKKFSCKNSHFENLNDAHEKTRIDVCFSAASSQRSSVRVSHGSGSFDFRCKATPIIIKPRPNDHNIVGCNMLCAFGHPVATFATCWGLLAQSWQFTTSIPTHATYVAMYWVDMLRSFGRGLTSMPVCLFATYWAKMERRILFMRIVKRYLQRQQFFSAAPLNQGRENVSVWMNFLFMFP